MLERGKKALGSARTRRRDGPRGARGRQVGSNSALPCLLALEAMQKKRVLGWDANKRAITVL